MFQTKVVEKIKTHILCPVTFFFFENRAVCEIMWKKILYCRAGYRWHYASSAWIPKAQSTHTHNM